MKFTIIREALLKPLQLVTGVVERKQSLPILSNLLLQIKNDTLLLVGTDLEVELISRIKLDQAYGDGSMTLPARKLLDICKSSPENAEIHFYIDASSNQRIKVKAGRSVFTLSTLSADDFPSIEDNIDSSCFSIDQSIMRKMIEKTAFAMANHDVRYYLNGMYLDISDQFLRLIASDGHRLALCSINNVENMSNEKKQVIIPRKGILEIARLLGDSGEAKFFLNDNHIRVEIGGNTLTSKKIDSGGPDYDKVIPKIGDKKLTGDRIQLRETLKRVSILSNEKYRSIQFNLTDNSLKVQAKNRDQEEAIEELDLNYIGDPIEIGCNVDYLLDVLSVLSNEQVCVSLTDASSTICIEENNENMKSMYVVMPIM